MTDPPFKVFQTTGYIKEVNELLIDVPLPFPAHSRVKIAISMEDSDEDMTLFAVKNPAFADIFDDSEDIYTLEDGEPFNG